MGGIYWGGGLVKFKLNYTTYIKPRKKIKSSIREEKRVGKKLRELYTRLLYIRLFDKDTETAYRSAEISCFCWHRSKKNFVCNLFRIKPKKERDDSMIRTIACPHKGCAKMFRYGKTHKKNK